MNCIFHYNQAQFVANLVAYIYNYMFVSLSLLFQPKFQARVWIHISLQMDRREAIET